MSIGIGKDEAAACFHIVVSLPLELRGIIVLIHGLNIISIILR